MSTILKLRIPEYEAMIARGAFDRLEHRRIELIRGELRERSPIGPQHDNLVAWLNRWSVSHTPEDVDIRAQTNISIPELESVPEPDLAWVRPGHYGRRRPEPADVLLVIEVAHSSLSYDLGEKKELYSEAGIQEYWVVDIAAEQIHVFRRPSGNQCQESFTARAGQTIAPEAEPGGELDVGKMFLKCAQ